MGSEIFTGVVEKWFVSGGYGFIKTDDNKSFFIHARDTITHELEPGQIISFRIGQYKNRPVAVQVGN